MAFSRREPSVRKQFHRRNGEITAAKEMKQERNTWSVNEDSVESKHDAEHHPSTERRVTEAEARAFYSDKLSQKRAALQALKDQDNEQFAQLCPFAPNINEDRATSLQRLVDFTEHRKASARATVKEEDFWTFQHEATHWENFLDRSEAFLRQRRTVLDLKRQNQEIEEIDECTFQPQVSSSIILPLRDSGDVFLDLYKKGLKHRAAREQIQKEQADRAAVCEMEGCTFQPNVFRERKAPVEAAAPPIESYLPIPKETTYSKLHIQRSSINNTKSTDFTLRSSAPNHQTRVNNTANLSKRHEDIRSKHEYERTAQHANEHFSEILRSIQELNRIIATPRPSF